MKLLFLFLLSCLLCPSWGFYSANFDYADASWQIYATLRVELDETVETVTITVILDDDRYVGVGFGQSVMDGTYAIIWSDDDVMERVLGGSSDRDGTRIYDHPITVVSDTTSNDKRTLVLSRATDVGDTDYYDFSGITGGDTIPFIMAIGTDKYFGAHRTRQAAELTFYPPTVAPTSIPSTEPTARPSDMPSDVSSEPTSMPSLPTSVPSEVTIEPTNLPSSEPTSKPTTQPTVTMKPTDIPSVSPSFQPSALPTDSPASEVAGASFSSGVGADFVLSANVTLFDDDSVCLELSGRDGQWIGFGFGAQVMNGTYALIINGNGDISERELADQAAGTLLDGVSNYTVMSNAVEDGVRVVVLKGYIGDLPYDFSTLLSLESLDYIIATSEAVELEAHTSREFGAAEIYIFETSITSTQETDDVPVGDAARRNVFDVFGVVGVSAWCFVIVVVGTTFCENV